MPRSRATASEPGSTARSRRSPSWAGCTLPIARRRNDGGRRKSPYRRQARARLGPWARIGSAKTPWESPLIREGATTRGGESSRHRAPSPSDGANADLSSVLEEPVEIVGVGRED